MINLYDEYYEELGDLDLIEQRVRRRISQQLAAQRYGELVEQELLEQQQLLTEHPELAPLIHAVNMGEIAATQQGMSGAMETGESGKKGKGFLGGIFGGL